MRKLESKIVGPVLHATAPVHQKDIRDPRERQVCSGNGHLRKRPSGCRNFEKKNSYTPATTGYDRQLILRFYSKRSNCYAMFKNKQHTFDYPGMQIPEYIQILGTCLPRNLMIKSNVKLYAYTSNSLAYRHHLKQGPFSAR